MASCDDDFSLLGDDNAVTATTAAANANPNPNYHHQQAFTNKYKAPAAHLNADDDVVSTDGDGYSDGALNNNNSSFQVVSVNPYGNESNPYEADADLNKNRVSASIEKRTDREEVSESGTPYSYKKSKLTSSSAVSGGAGGEYRKDREEWTDTAIACLLEAYMEKFMQLNRGNLRGRDWEEVAAMVSDRCEKQTKSVEQCKNKVDNLKKRYKLERHRLSNSGNSVSHWPWFKQMDQIIGNSPSAKATAASPGGASAAAAAAAAAAVPDEEKQPGAGSANSTRPSKRYGAASSSATGQINNVKPKASPSPRWHRVVFKISGAALAGSVPHNIDPKVAMLIAREVSIACRLGVEVAVVVGGRNFFCGDTWVNATGLDRSTAYQIGMMATVMNSILLQSALEKLGVQTHVQSTFSMPEVAEPYSRQRAIRHLEKGRVVIFGGIGAGTGNPLFSTDTAAALRASEIQADALLKGTNVDGVYVRDSRNNNVIAEHLSFRELASRGASSMDMMAVTYCEEKSIPVVLFNLHEPGNISRALSGEQVGTLVDQTGSVG